MRTTYGKSDALPDVPFDEKTPLYIIGEVDYDLLEGTEVEVEELIFKEKEKPEDREQSGEFKE
ncbi:MAG: hypothetical protein AB7D05_04710 [Mangrovibacterium sp.]